MATSLSKMNKKELYEECKKLKESEKYYREKYEEYQSISNDYADEENMYGDYIGTPKSLQKYIVELQKELEDVWYLYKWYWFGSVGGFPGGSVEKLMKLQTKYKNQEWEDELYGPE
jgi:hypothetical protein